MIFLEKIEQKKFYILISILICIIVGILYSIKFVPKKYVASTSFVLVKLDGKQTSTGTLEINNNVVSNFREIVKSDLTINQIKKDLNLQISNNEIRNNVNLIKEKNSDTIKITYKSSNVESSLKINEKILDSLSKKILDMYANTKVYIVDTSHFEKEDNSQMIQYALLGLSIGVLIDIIYIYLIILLEKNIKKVSDIETELFLKTLTEIPRKNKKENKFELIINESEKSKTLKAFNELRTNIQFLNVNNKNKKVILIASPENEEGKSYVATNMAISYANAGKKVILIDANMSFGKQSKMLNVPNNLGLSNYLAGLDLNGMEINEFLNKFVKETSIKNLSLITSGVVPPNTAELLASSKMVELLKDLNVFYDVVIIDGTSILNTTDSLILTRLATATIIVVDLKKNSREDLLKTKKDIQNVGGNIIGVVLNKVKVKKEKINIKEKCLELTQILKEKIKVLKSKINKIFEKKEIKLLVGETVTIEEKESEEIKTKKVRKIKAKKENVQDVEKADENIEKKNIKDTVNKIKTTTLEKITKIKEKIKSDYNKLQEKIKNIIEKEKSKKELKQKAKQEENANKENQEKQKQDNKQEDQEVKQAEVSDENIEKYLNNENNVLVISDAENAYCRVFSKYCFTEKLIRGLDKTDGTFKDQYSNHLISVRLELLKNQYDLSKEQLSRIDTLIYVSLCDYDECLWIEKEMASNKAEKYILCITKEYEKMENESDYDYKVRCQKLRKIELLKNEIEIEYKLENIWKTSKMSIVDKFALLKCAKAYEVNNKHKDDLEKIKSKKNKKFYNEIVQITEKKSEEENKVQENKETEKTPEELEVDRIIKEEQEKIKREQEEYKKEQERIRLEKKAEQEKIRAEKKIERQERRKAQKEENAKKRLEKQLAKEEERKQKELEREKRIEEERIEEELLVDNLYPKTKNNKNL